MTSSPSTYVAAPAVRLRATAEGALVLNLRTNSYYSLNETGQVAWEVLVEGGTVDDAAAALCAQHDVELDVARKLVAELVAELVAAELLECAPGQPAD
jgi:hypothetical protein